MEPEQRTSYTWSLLWQVHIFVISFLQSDIPCFSVGKSDQSRFSGQLMPKIMIYFDQRELISHEAFFRKVRAMSVMRYLNAEAMPAR